jgi:DNA polymerase-3 subunit epsilon
VVDVETSGLDPRSADLLAIAGVALRVEAPAPRIVLHDSFEITVRPRRSVLDRANILVHGIGVQAQRDGAEPAHALDAFADWAGDAPLLGYHSGFDEIMLRRACQLAERATLPNPWLDLAPLMRDVFPGLRHRSLDDWLTAFNLLCWARHQAAADALVTAQLALRALRRWEERGEPLAFEALQRAARAARWLRLTP